MRKVTKDYLTAPGELGAVPKHNTRLIRIFNGTGVPKTKKIYNSIYGEKKVHKKLAHLYKNKCAYCETVDKEFEIEHYRPKRSVDGEVHDGYFWLCYEWSNLLPACHDCNKGKSKAAKFPIEGTRVTRPVIKKLQYKFIDHNLLSRRLKREYPLLIHPEEPDFDPFAFFKFDNTGWMLPAANKKTRKYRRAAETIDNIVRLNRDKLYLTRRKTDLRNFEKRFLGLFFLYLKLKKEGHHHAAEIQLESNFSEILKDIKIRSNPKEEYSFFWNYVYDNIYFFLPKKLKKRPRDRTRFHKMINEFKIINPPK